MITITQNLTTKTGLTFSGAKLKVQELLASRVKDKVTVSFSIFTSQAAMDNAKVPEQVDEIQTVVEYPINDVLAIIGAQNKLLDHGELILKKYLDEKNIQYSES